MQEAHAQLAQAIGFATQAGYYNAAKIFGPKSFDDANRTCNEAGSFAEAKYMYRWQQSRVVQFCLSQGIHDPASLENESDDRLQLAVQAAFPWKVQMAQKEMADAIARIRRSKTDWLARYQNGQYNKSSLKYWDPVDLVAEPEDEEEAADAPPREPPPRLPLFQTPAPQTLPHRGQLSQDRSFRPDASFVSISGRPSLPNSPVDRQHAPQSPPPRETPFQPLSPSTSTIYNIPFPSPAKTTPSKSTISGTRSTPVKRFSPLKSPGGGKSSTPVPSPSVGQKTMPADVSTPTRTVKAQTQNVPDGDEVDKAIAEALVKLENMGI
ncbi:Hypothetical predicted protein [Lecanosticta acicola]|uniref:Uncharacterized protein n=1 Tax=Lecanosticta acicola TaxID=111012 RepID=A0AAI9EFN0_9PEZI|nr:Hypothetical predicted protein [Lecanosticta acicola]